MSHKVLKYQNEDRILFSGGQHARKRRRTSDTIDIEDRLESLITRVGEKVCYEY